MKKTSKMFGAVALSAALAAGMSLPAFATSPSAGPDSDAITKAGDNESIVNLISFKDAGEPDPIVPDVPDLEYKLTQLKADTGDGSLKALNVTPNYQMIANIPVSATVATPEKGGALNVPTNYSIKNRGYSDVFVNNVTAEPATDWVLSREKNATKNAMYLDLTNGLTKVQLPDSAGTAGGAVTADFNAAYNGTASDTVKQAVNSNGEALYLVFKYGNTVTDDTQVAKYVTMSEIELRYSGAQARTDVPADALTIDNLPTTAQLKAATGYLYQPVMVSIQSREVCNNAMKIDLAGQAFLPENAADTAVLDANTPNVMRITYTIAPTRTATAG